MVTNNENLSAIWQILEAVKDPEIPVISLRELGVLRDIQCTENGIEVVVTPTYSGCPAMAQMVDDIQAVLIERGIEARIRTQLSPAWTSDWLSEETREKLRAYGIAPPQRQSCGTNVVHFMKEAAVAEWVPCPQCGSRQTVVSAAFGSTACKALYKCLSCQEPFDYFKPY